MVFTQRGSAPCEGPGRTQTAVSGEIRIYPDKLISGQRPVFWPYLIGEEWSWLRGEVVERGKSRYFPGCVGWGRYLLFKLDQLKARRKS